MKQFELRVEPYRQEHRKSWRTSWFEQIEQLANEKMQRATWLNEGNRNPYYTFREYNYHYVRFGFESNGGIDGGNLTREEEDIMAELRALLDAYSPPDGNDEDHEAILNDSKWRAVVTAAQVARNRLAAIITDEEERRALFEVSEHAIIAAHEGRDTNPS